jgi:hypothetical protein
VRRDGRRPAFGAGAGRASAQPAAAGARSVLRRYPILQCGLHARSFSLNESCQSIALLKPAARNE